MDNVVNLLAVALPDRKVSIPPYWHALPWCFSVREVKVDDAVSVSVRKVVHPGDVVLAEVISVGQHRRLQLAQGRYRALNVGDLFVAAAGCRYAVDQYEGRGEIRAGEACALLAGGGVVGVLESQHAAMNTPTVLRIVGVVQDAEGRRLRLSRYARSASGERPNQVIVVVGSGMNAGKTTAAAALIRGLHCSGLRVAGVKGTGTGSFGDVQAYEDAGAHWVGDFGLTGLASTYRQPVERLCASLETLLAMARQQDCDVAVVELADGLLQTETRALLLDARSRMLFDGLIYAAADTLSAASGLDMLERWGWRPMAVSGLISRAPLAIRELRTLSGLEVWRREELADPALANRLIVPLAQAAMDH